MPFENMSADEENEYFSDGISEELLNTLVRIDGLQVASRTSAFSFKNQDVDIPTIAARLNVAHIVEGSVRRSGTEVRITAQLIDVEFRSAPVVGSVYAGIERRIRDPGRNRAGNCRRS